MQLSRLHHDVQYSSTHSASGNAFAALGNVLYHFGESKVQPYVTFGIGALKADYVRKGYSEWYTGEPDKPEDRVYRRKSWEHEVNATKIAIKIGGGFKAAITPNLSIRPELNTIDTTIGKGFNGTALKFSIAFSYHW